jgi:phage shock protein A
MGLFQRAHDIIEAKANRALDTAEKPDEMLDLSYEKMLEQLTQVRRALVDISRKSVAQSQIAALEPQHEQMVEQEEKLTHTLSALQERVNAFRSQKETLKAQYTAAQAVSTVDESVSGISKSIGDSGAALQRAQDKIATMQAHAGALDELLESGVLEDVGGGTDDIQKELDEVGSAGAVDNELAELKAQLGTGKPAAVDSGTAAGE